MISRCQYREGNATKGQAMAEFLSSCWEARKHRLEENAAGNTERAKAVVGRRAAAIFGATIQGIGSGFKRAGSCFDVFCF